MNMENQDDSVMQNSESSNVKSEHKPMEGEQELVVSKAEKQTGDANKAPKEIGGPKGLEPTRYGDWESKGRCYDF